MNNNLKRSIDRAIGLMNTPADYENYISIKIKPAVGECCCLNHWQRTWTIVNDYIYPYGPVKNEAAVLIEKNNVRFVLECHESGPEVILYLGIGTASIVLVKSVIDLITTLLKTRQNEYHNRSGRFKIIKHFQTKGLVEEEEIVEIDLPLSEDIIKKLNDTIRNSIEENK